MEGLKGFFRMLKDNKGKIFATFVSTLFFLFVLFPFDDLSDLVSVQVSKVTGNAVYLQFQKLKMSLFPTPGLNMKKVYLEMINTPALSAEDLTITPSVMGLLSKKPYGKVSVQGLMGGDVDLSLSKGSKSDAGTEREKIDVHVQKIALHDLKQMVNLPAQLRGHLQLNSTILADLNWKEQPDVELDLNISQLEVTQFMIAIPNFGSLNLPDINLGQVALKGRMNNGSFNIEKAVLGKDNDELQGTIKGSLGIVMEDRGGGMPAPRFGSYNFELELKVKKSFQDKAAALLEGFLHSYKTPTPDGAIYRFKISGANFMEPAAIGALR